MPRTEPQELIDYDKSFGITKTVTTNFNFAQIREKPQRNLRMSVSSSMSQPRPYSLKRQSAAKVGCPKALVNAITRDQWKTQIVAEVDKIVSNANERHAELNKLIYSSAPNVPMTARFLYSSVCTPRFISDCIQNIRVYYGICAFILAFYLVGFVLMLNMVVFLLILALLYFFCDIPLCRTSFCSPSPSEVDWYTKMMNSHPELDTAAINSMVKDELEKLAARLSAAFPSYRVRLWTGVEVVRHKDNVSYFDSFILIFDKIVPHTEV